MFSSILSKAPKPPVCAVSDGCLHDLQLDRLPERLAALSGWEGVRQVFLRPLASPEEIRFRQEILQDLADEAVRGAAAAFSEALLQLDGELTALRQRPDRDLMDCCAFLQLADRFCTALERLQALPRAALHSCGLNRLRDELDALLQSADYRSQRGDVDALYAGLDELHFCMQLKNGRFRIRPYEGQVRMDADIDALFSRFQQDAPSIEPPAAPQLRHVHHIDAAVLELLAHWYPAPLQALSRFPDEHPDFLTADLVRTAQELCFYLGWLRLIGPLQEAGLPFCCAALSEDGALSCEGGFDLTLALRLQEEGRTVVPNSFALGPDERLLVITGPNQGGKTTFARSAGQLCYLTALGCTVPGVRAVCGCFDFFGTHFNREEDLDSLSGKLQDELLRLRELLSHTTDRSLLIINEIFASTTLSDAVFLGRKMMDRLAALGCRAVCVTFLDELASYDAHTVSMMSTVDPQDLSRRTFRLVRRPADGLAFALQLAEKYGLTYEALKRRLSR